MAGNGNEDFESLARRYWGAWGEAMRAAAGAAQGFGVPGPGATPFGGAGPGAIPGFGAPHPFGAMPGFGASSPFGGPGIGGFGAGLFGASAPPADPGTQAWRDALSWWSRFAQPAQGDGAATIERFNAQVRDWFGQMQQVAARFAGQQPAAAEVVAAWKEALGRVGGDPFGAVFRDLGGAGPLAFEDWLAQVEPFLALLRGEAKSWLQVPAFGFAREHQERLQKLAAFQIDYQQGVEAYNALLAEASRQAFDLFEAKLQERASADAPVDSARALFDLWIDAAEDAYAKVALSAEFGSAYSAMLNAQMRLRGAVQAEIERACALLGMPTRTELDSAHRKIVALERSLRRQQRAARAHAAPTSGAAASDGGHGAPPESAPPPAPAGRRKAAKPAVRKAAPPRRAPAAKASKPKGLKPAAKRSTRATRSAAPAAARRAPANGFTSLIPAAPVPLAPAAKPRPGAR